MINLKKKKQTSKKEPPKKPTKTDFDELNKQIIKEETNKRGIILKTFLL